ncbi:porin family protein [Sulfurovum sp. zt1-1]|uniref:Porin family protein n=1 Tax=Sulfurovum zhangzhouensis TaxID=3019067 RepID=A0ABT7QXQ1_9BACT|nr:porin family protein [Sulfurovum zhangzhouensis]MDM5271600.1 porin family protein [Sulfurovum zhangzhouensis]
MKKITSSFVAAMAVSTFAFAGGDIAPVEPVVETQEAQSSIFDGFYVGLGYTKPMTISNVCEYDDCTIKSQGLTAQVGYEFNENIAAEVRYIRSSGDADHSTQGDYDMSIKSLGFYVKGMYAIGDFSPYVYLGAANTKLDLANNPSYFYESKTTLGYGLGLSYSVTENISVFVDYMHNDLGAFQPGEYYGWNGDLDFTATTYGVTYKF